MMYCIMLHDEICLMSFMSLHAKTLSLEYEIIPGHKILFCVFGNIHGIGLCKQKIESK